jgi:hypothetical protein
VSLVLKVTSVGNPELEPQFTNSLELNYTKPSKKVPLPQAFFVRSINNEINRIIYPDPQNTETKFEF